MRQEAWLQFVAYVLVSIGAVGLAFLISMRFLSRSHAQEPQVGSGAPPAATAPAVPAPVQAAPPPTADTPPPPPPTDPAQATPSEPPPTDSSIQSTPPGQVGAPQPRVAQPPPQAPPAPRPRATPPPAVPAPAPNPVVVNKAKPPEQSMPPEKESAAAVAAEVQGFLEPFIYDSKNRRDPFMPYTDFRPTENQPTLSPLQRFDLEDLKLVGIMWDVHNPKAMFLDPEKQVHVASRDESIGRKNGYIAVIREGEVVVVESVRKDGEVQYKPRVLRMER